MTPPRATLRRARVLLLAGVLAACGDSDPTGPSDDGPTGPDRVVVDPISASIGVDDTLQVSARVVHADGTPVDAELGWRSTNPEVASVDATGLVVGLEPGFTRIEAVAGDLVGGIPLSVGPPPELVIAPDSLELMLGERRQLTTMVTNALTDEIQWMSSDSSSVWVGSTGTIVRVGAHGATITATLASHPHITVEIPVTPSSELDIFPARPRLAVGDRLPLLASVPGDPLDWEVADSTVAMPAPSGILEGIAPGETMVRASSPPDPSLAAVDTAVVVTPSGAARIEAFSGADGVPVSADALAGTVRVDVRLGEVEAPAGVSRVELLLDGWVAADRTYLGGAGMWSALVDTRGYPNGPHRITARLLNEDDEVLAQAAGVMVTVVNE